MLLLLTRAACEGCASSEDRARARCLPTRRPRQPARRPLLPARRPSVPARRPSLPARRPSLPARRPSLPARRPSRRPARLQLPSNWPRRSRCARTPPSASSSRGASARLEAEALRLPCRLQPAAQDARLRHLGRRRPVVAAWQRDPHRPRPEARLWFATSASRRAHRRTRTTRRRAPGTSAWCPRSVERRASWARATR